LFNFIPHTVKLDDVANLRDAAQVGHDETAYRINLLLVIVDVEMLVEFMQQQ
jgi:hypothetical protein